MSAARRTAIIAALALGAVCVGCTSVEPPEPSPAASTPPAEPSPSPSPSPIPSSSGESVDYAEPATVEGELARALFAIVDGVPTTTSDVRAPLEAGGVLSIDGQCTGGESVSFSLLSASVGDSGTTLLEGTIECEQARADPFTYELPAEGPVQLTLAAGEGVTEAWAVARQR